MDAKIYITALEVMGKEEYRALTPYRVNLPIGRSGPWRVRHFETELDVRYLRFARDGRPPGLGKFTALNHDDRGLVMSDTNPEVADMMHYLQYLRGHVLITGLGLGMVPHALMTMPQYTRWVKSITIVEIDKDVIKLVGPTIKKLSPCIKIIHADAHEWMPTCFPKFGAAWHDIWDIGPDKEQVAMIRKHYRKYVENGQQYFWGYANRRRKVA